MLRAFDARNLEAERDDERPYTAAEASVFSQATTSSSDPARHGFLGRGTWYP